MAEKEKEQENKTEQLCKALNWISGIMFTLCCLYGLYKGYMNSRFQLVPQLKMMAIVKAVVLYLCMGCILAGGIKYGANEFVC